MSASGWYLIGGKHEPSNWLVTTAIGGTYFNRWSTGLEANWLRYAEAHGLGIAVAIANLWEEEEPRLNGAWQKLLAPRSLRTFLNRDVRCAVIDTDVVISPTAPDIFAETRPGNVGVVSQVHGIPLPLQQLKNRIAFLRRSYLNPNFPLDSLLNAKPRQIFMWAGLSPAFDDFACTGMFVMDTATHADMFANWYLEGPSSRAYESIGDWEQTYLNYRIQQLPEIQWLEYSWQALWLFEVAAYYPFLYDESCSQELRSWCLASSLIRNNFLHLAGDWESALVDVEQIALPSHAEGNQFATFVESLARSERREAVGLNLGKVRRKATNLDAGSQL